MLCLEHNAICRYVVIVFELQDVSYLDQLYLTINEVHLVSYIVIARRATVTIFCGSNWADRSLSFLRDGLEDSAGASIDNFVVMPSTKLKIELLAHANEDDEEDGDAGG